MTVLLPLSLAVDDAKVTPGLLGFVVFVALGVATWLLIRSMNRHLRRVDVPRAADLDEARDAGTDHPSADDPPASDR